MAVDALLAADSRHDVLVADAKEPERSGVTGRHLDATSPDSLRDAIADADVAVNCLGPFYRFGPPVLQAAVDAGVDYVDVCDDLEPTRTMLAMDSAARGAGVTALVGMGNSPGVANLLVRLCADHLLDEVHEVDIMHVHGGEPDEGPAVLKHRIHAMRNPVPMFIDGEFRDVWQLRDDGQAQVRRFTFRDLGDISVFPYPHPETITLPQHFPTLRRATNLGAVFPPEYFARTQQLVRDGVPVEEAVARLRDERPQFLRRAGVTGPAGCLAVEVRGSKAGEPHSYVFQLSSRTAGAGEGTGIPVATAALLMLQGRVSGPGVFPPEAAVSPDDFLPLAFDLMRRLGVSAGDPTGAVHVTHSDPDGQVSEIPLTV